ncbi:Tigger transposable element-derived protein 4 [Nosema granulosis]|uniref:Tigger transposable element-derived protein 4 n=1 Tax=Nosema granulosis TaxID=83296 RepID=A0A9P6GWF8_9MICR|nr:Tigger transposable element-derived protein 4 [Nosema granulosis]
MLKKEKNKSQRELAVEYNISLGFVNKLLNTEEIDNISEIFNENKRIPTCSRTGGLDSILYRWFVESRLINVTITTDSLKTMALEIAEKLNIKGFKASSGWVCKFVKRNKLASKRINGEAGLVDPSILNDFKASLDSKLAEYEDINI